MIEWKMLGVRFRLDFLFVALVTLFLLTDRTGMSVIALLACFIHELGHLIMFFLVGYTPKALVFELMGIRLIKPEQALSPGREALVQCAGSLTNLIVFLLLIRTLDSVSYWSVFAATHLLLGIFNLLPLKSLDGGKLLNLFCLRFFGEQAAESVCSAADLTVTAGLLLLTVYMVLSGKRSLALATFSGGVVVSLIARLAARKKA